MQPLLTLNGIERRYGDVAALDGVSFSVAPGAYVALLGPSGSGKTTLLRVIAGFEQPDAGHVVFDGRRIRDIPTHRRGIGIVFQNFALFPHLTVEKNVSFGLLNRESETNMDRRAIDAKVRDMIALVGLKGLESRDMHQISGGQRQRVALARTLVTEPRLVLLDEPLGALDANLRARMRDELRSLHDRLGVTFLHVTGSEAEALAMGDTIIVLDRGRIAQVDLAESIYNHPASPQVARLLNCYNLFEGAVEGREFVSSVGRFPLDGARAPGRPGKASAYAIRHDRIAVRPVDRPISPDEAGLAATFVASEYSGSSVLSFFATAGGQVIEVEDHLSLREPPNYAQKQGYALAWEPRDALVFA
ncbi:ABC transporter ATP-binding protein [Methylocapsa sp. S129]|uniref:ABC transporter ATP-binding protein n=1 Tax=Methylocapsa sp. S129 TaxID=1641869 RepID=UPI00131B5251|nr:ABC transporter ATP-binding protein [Methylocapsa sp. S129]